MQHRWPVNSPDAYPVVARREPRRHTLPPRRARRRDRRRRRPGAQAPSSPSTLRSSRATTFAPVCESYFDDEDREVRFTVPLRGVRHRRVRRSGPQVPDIGSGGRPSPPPVATAVAHLPASQGPPGLTPRGGSLGARSVVIVGLGNPVHAQAGHRAGARRADGDSPHRRCSRSSVTTARRTSCSRWMTPPGSPRPSRTCEPVRPVATASVCSTYCSPRGSTSACARWPKPRPRTGSGN